ncbi:glycosyltransferase family 9 protein [bacterium]|nr:glycosyltransferase family 9 protein [bacterium]
MSVDPASILIVKLGAVGDCVHTLPILVALRDRFPDARIGWVVEPKSRGVVEDHPALDETILFPRPEIQRLWHDGRARDAYRLWRTFARDLARRRYEIAIDFQNLFRSGLVAYASRAPRRIGFRRLREGNFAFMNEHIVPPDTAKHAVEKYAALIAPLGARSIPDRISIHVPPDKKATVDRFIDAQLPHGAAVVAINPGASWPNKRLDPARYGTLAARLAELGAAPIVIWGPGEEALRDAVVAASNGAAVAAPPTDLKELAQLLSRCRLYVGNDSGPMHIAAAMGCGVVAVFGPSDPRRVGPYTPARRVVAVPVPCAPCWKRRCPLPRVYCMDRVSADDLYVAAAELLEHA